MSDARASALLVRAIIASQFAPAFMFSGVAVALPSLGADLRAGAVSLGLVETLFLAGAVALLLPVGRLADAGEKRTLFRVGLLALGAASLLIGTLSNVPAILVTRFVQGAASALVTAAGPALLAEIVPAERRGRAYGASIASIYAGLTLGPVAGGLLVELWGWRAVFIGGALPLLAAWLLMRRVLPSGWTRAPGAVHAPSAALLVAAMLCLVIGSSTLGLGPAGFAWLGGGFALGTAFVLLQARLPRPLLDLASLGRNVQLRTALLVQLLLYMHAASSVFLLSIYLQVTLGHPAAVAGQVIAIGTVLMVVAAPLAGRLADRFRPQAIAAIGLICVLVTTLLALTLDDRSRIAFVALILVVQGLGYALFSSPNMTVIMNSVGRDGVGMASALGATSRSLGMVAGMLVTALLLSLTIGNERIADHPLRFVDTLVTAFAALAGFTALALGLALRALRQARAAGAATT